MGALSAYAALIAAVPLGLFAVLSVLTGRGAGTPGFFVVIAAVAALAVGAARTLRKQSGGLRLLAGSWGLAGGAYATAMQHVGFSTSDIAEKFLLLACLAGLLVTAFHREAK